MLAEGFGGTVLTMYDTGANVNIVVTKVAESLGLQGRPVTQTITTAGGERTVCTTKQYWVPLRKRSGEVYRVLCLGMDRITEDVELVDVSKAARLFGVDAADVFRPKGQVDLILGIGEAGVFPVHKRKIGNLQLLGSCFGSGQLLAGSHSCLKYTGQRKGAGPRHFRRKGHGTGSRVRTKPARVNLFHSEFECLTTRAEASFCESEELGPSQPARGRTCNGSSEVFQRGEAKCLGEFPSRACRGGSGGYTREDLPDQEGSGARRVGGQ